jgi:predicted DNA-binding transcriptional regulator YafY
MNRAAWLQDRRMQKFRDVLSRWEAGDLSMMEAGELLGMSERQFRRYRDLTRRTGLPVWSTGGSASRRRSGFRRRQPR